jgi:single-strand DNA-binding protein
MSLNKVILQGNLVADPETRTRQSGNQVSTFRIAVGRRYAKESDEVKADFFTIVAWRGLSDFVSKYFTKGKAIVVVGSLQNRSFTTQNGEKRYITEVIAEECHFAGSKEQSDNSNDAVNTPMPNYEEISSEDELPF